jgi:16S rRNA (uracil1498-N3)-methyltransferase
VPSSNPRRDAAAHVFVASLDAPALDPDDAHHLTRVLRLRNGEAVTASDGAGSWRSCRFNEGALEPDGEIVFEPALSPPVWSVQKLTEVGVDVIAPLLSARSVVRWDADKAARHHARLVRVAREAAMQSRRAWLPSVRPVVDFAEAVTGLAALGPVALAEPGGGAVSLDHPCLLVGPEGGWAAEEVAAVPVSVSLGPTILRAETATLAAGLLVCALRARSVRIHDG